MSEHLPNFNNGFNNGGPSPDHHYNNPDNPDDLGWEPGGHALGWRANSDSTTPSLADHDQPWQPELGPVDDTMPGRSDGRALQPMLEQLEWVEDRIGQSDLSPEHQRMVIEAAAETLAHLDVEDRHNLNHYLNEAHLGRRLQPETHERVGAYLDDREAMPMAEVLALAMGRPDARHIRAFELGHVHHLLVYDEAAEADLQAAVEEACRQRQVEAISPSLHKVTILHRARNESDVITGAVVSIKHVVARHDDGTEIRHRQTFFVEVDQLLTNLEPYRGFGGSVEDQKLHIRRALGKRRSQVLDTASVAAGKLVKYANDHPEALLTSIYYACTPPPDATHQPALLPA